MSPTDPLRAALERALGAQYEIVRLLRCTWPVSAPSSVPSPSRFSRRRWVSAEAQERFRREARTAAKLTHPNIVPLHTFGEVEGMMYFVMGYVEGESLADRMRRDNELPPAEVRRILGAMADALDYAHRQGVIHRDIKPDNILLEAESGRPMTPRAIGEGIEAIYGELAHQGFAKSNQLQTVANMMYLAPGSAREVAARAAAFKARFKEHKVRVYQRDWDELAMLSILGERPAPVVKRVVAIREELAEIRPRIEEATTFGLAVGIAFLEFATAAQHGGSVSHAKVLMDVQSLIAAQQAALAAAGAAAAASAAM